MAPVLTKADNDLDSPRALVEQGAAPPRRARRIGHTFTALLKSNLKNLLADCSGQVVLRAAAGDVAPRHFSAHDAGAMKNALAEHCQVSDGIMDGEKRDQQDSVMGLHSTNSARLQDLLQDKKQLAESLTVSSPPPDLAEMLHDLESVTGVAPFAGGNGDVPVDLPPAVASLVDGVGAEPAREERPTAAVLSAVPVPVSAAPPATAEATRCRQAQLDSRAAALMRRLCALQARSARAQTSGQVGVLLTRLGARHASSSAGAPALPASDITEVLSSPNAKNFSTTQLVNLVLNNKSAAAATVAPPPAAPPEGVASAGRLEREAAAAASRPADVARRQVERLVAAADSDATESSSGGESGDEFEHGWDDFAQERAAPIRKRALWRWMTDRSSVACRWSWLASQVTDLEFRIRQLKELHRQLRTARPPADEPRGSSAPAARLVAAGELGGAGDASAAALRDRTKASDAQQEVAAAADDDDGQCARTRRRLATQRRRLFSVWRAPRRPAGGVPARCRCEPSSGACIVCSGRADFMPRLRVDAQPVRERLALLDWSVHPVLSLPGDAALSLGYDALLRSARWQQNHLHARPRGPRLVTKELGGQQAPAAAAVAAAPAATAPTATTPCSRPSFHRRKPGLLKRLPELDGDGELLLSGGGGGGGGGSNGRVGRPPKSARRSRSVSAAGHERSAAAGDESPERRDSRDARDRPPAQRHRHRQHSYDIDNIVIPASMASTARIEKPKYKEIVTPGWRTVELQPATVNGDGAAAELEQAIDDASLEARHLAAELAERRRLYQSCQAPAGQAGPAGLGRGRHLHPPDWPAAAESSPEPAAAATTATTPGTADRPHILRHQYLAQPCGYPGRKFPLSESHWKELVSSADRSARSPLGWRSPASITGSSTESAPETEEQRLLLK